MLQRRPPHLLTFPVGVCPRRTRSEKSIGFVRSVAEGNLVALHTHQTWPGGDEYVTMDFFRFDSNGRIVEHWDAIQQIPEESANGNPMY